MFQSRLDQIITTSTSNRSKMHSTSFFSKTVGFCIFHLNICSEKQLSRNTAYFLPNKMHIFRHKFISILFALGQRKMSLESDQLEVSGSVDNEYSLIEPPTTELATHERLKSTPLT